MHSLYGNRYPISELMHVVICHVCIMYTVLLVSVELLSVPLSVYMSTTAPATQNAVSNSSRYFFR